MEKELKNKERHIGYEVRTLDNMIGRRVNVGTPKWMRKWGSPVCRHGS